MRKSVPISSRLIPALGFAARRKVLAKGSAGLLRQLARGVALRLRLLVADYVVLQSELARRVARLVVGYPARLNAAPALARGRTLAKTALTLARVRAIMDARQIALDACWIARTVARLIAVDVF